MTNTITDNLGNPEATQAALDALPVIEGKSYVRGFGDGTSEEYVDVSANERKKVRSRGLLDSELQNRTDISRAWLSKNIDVGGPRTASRMQALVDTHENGDIVRAGGYNYVINKSLNLEDSATEDIGVAGIDAAFPFTGFQYGVKGDGITDDTAAYQRAVLTGRKIIVPHGDYNIEGTIEMFTARTLELFAGARLIKRSSSPNTDPVIWMRGQEASLTGSGHGSFIYSEKRSPNGVVLVGHSSMSASEGNVNNNNIENITIRGAINSGQTTGDPDVALMLQNPQFNDLTCYFTNIHGVRVMDANIGIWFRGWANANTISNIQGFRIGNSALGIDKNVFMLLDGAIDNTITGCFFHQSSNSIGMLIRELDNTANGGRVHSCYANSVRGFICEQGGPSAIGLKATQLLTSSYYEIRNNVAQGNNLIDGFRSYNKVIDINGKFKDSVTKTKLSANNASLNFQLSNKQITGIIRFGFVRVDVSAGDNGGATRGAAWYFYRCRTLSATHPTNLALVDSGGETGVFTLNFDPATGILSITTAEDSLVADVTYSSAAPNVAVY